MAQTGQLLTFQRRSEVGAKLFVGNLAWRTTDSDLEEAFGSCGQVVSAKVITDRQTGKSRGFGFVEMSSDDEANTALSSLNDTDLNGRNIRVSEARERERR